ncbi:protein mono-ADP-ribosyltransferase PARP12-like [Watersipora subatra]|uniref:protein mono-ADP-ribosyltransferase PARP12-like n=1 Tax=Watersipora subatra TaxID=2589382 RepID=UPI00355AEDA1
MTLCSAVDRALLAVKNRSKVRISVTNTNNKLLTNTQAAEVILIQILKFLLDHSDSTLEVAVRTGENLYEVYNDVHCQIKRQIVSQQIEIKAYSSDSGQASKTDQLEGYFEILKHIDVGVCKFEISSTSQEYCKIFEQLYPYFKNWSQLFLRHRFTYKISKIQNLILLAQYEAQKRKVEWLLAAEQSTFPAERKLLHATSKTAADKICEEEFNRNFSDSVYGTSLGAGTYFDTEAVVAKYGNKCFFVARVLTGKYYQDNRSVSRVNLLPTYHSTVDNVDNPNIFVVYHDAAAYPEYLIEFTY